MMRQIIALFHSQNNQQTTSTFQYHKGMTIKGKKNSKVKIIANKRNHNYWGNIFRRKRIMSEYFSDSAFGSQSDTKKELYKPWEDEELLKKLRTKLILLQYEYDENECILNENENENGKQEPKTKVPIAFMNDPNDFPEFKLQKEKQSNSINNKKDNK